ncbi:hypothetical protein [Streptomyces sp. NPDC101150]|uniref:hypothetical protein n=1 Tax=Streptomyces sp. NPDC101150 TaxID=3366114 RepID=UPI00380630A8
MSTQRPGKSDSELLETTDVPTLLRWGLGVNGSHHTALFGDGAVAAAITLDRQGALPRSVAFLAKVVRSGGTRYAAELDEPLPGEAAHTVRAWLASAADVAPDVAGDDAVARWVEAVAAVMELRHEAGTATAPTW